MAAGFAVAAACFGVLAGIDPLLAILAALSVGFTFCVLSNLYVGLILFVLVNFVAQVPTVAGPALSFAKVAGLLLAISWLATLVARQDARSDLLSAHPGATFLLVMFLSWVALGQVWAEDPGETLTALSRLALNAILFVIVFTAVRTRSQLFGVTAAFVAGATLNALYGLLLAAPNPGDPTRLATGIDEPGELAATCVAGLALSLGLVAAWKPQPLGRVAALVAVPLCAIAVFLAGSRGGLVALAVALAAFIVVSPRWRGRLIVVALVVVVAGIGFYRFAASEDLRARVSSIDNGSGRVDLWTVGWRMVEENPIGGVGAGNFSIAAVQYVLQPGSIEQEEYFVGTRSQKVVHNTYLEVWAETGIVGLLLFLGVIGFSLVSMLRAARAFERQRDVQMEILARALFVALAAFLAAAFFASREYTKDGWLLLGLGPAALAVARARDEAGDADPARGEGQPGARVAAMPRATNPSVQRPA